MKQKLFVPFFLILLVCITLSDFAASWKSNAAFGVIDSVKALSLQKPDLKLLESKESGIIDGAFNPELIPDVVAYSLLFRFVSNAQSADARSRVRHYIRQLGLGNQASYLCPNEKTSLEKSNDRDIDAFIAVANEFRRRVSVLDEQAIQIKQRKDWPNWSGDPRLAILQQQKESIVAALIESLPRRLSLHGADKVRLHVNERMKSRIKMKMPLLKGQVDFSSVTNRNPYFSIL